MLAERAIFRMALVTIEASSAHGVGTGRGDATHDVLLVRDANGLPFLPGSSVAGVLRHSFSRHYGTEAENALFGSLGEDGNPSWLSVAAGMLHDAADRPCEGLLASDRLANDPLLAALAEQTPLVRQRVALSHKGTAVDRGKFDVTLIPAGARYSTLLGYWCDGSLESRSAWTRLLTLLTGVPLRFGFGTRSGYGNFRVERLAVGEWDLRTVEGRTGYAARPRSRARTDGLEPWSIAESPSPAADLEVRLALQAEAGWRVGGGERSLSGSDADLLPQHESVIQWRNGRGSFGAEAYLLPASAVKGALRHRVAFHYRRLTGEFAAPGMDAAPEACPAVAALFGHADQESAAAGLLHFEDLRFEDLRFEADAHRAEKAMHNRIDRYTGGVIRGALFSEEVLWRTPLTLRLALPASDRRDAVPRLMRQALQATLEDLASGALPLGAGGARGHGVFVAAEGAGEPRWSDEGAWVRGGASPENEA